MSYSIRMALVASSRLRGAGGKGDQKCPIPFAWCLCLILLYRLTQRMCNAEEWV